MGDVTVEERVLAWHPLCLQKLAIPAELKVVHTRVRVVGQLDSVAADSGVIPLVLLHGGPGSTCTYFELLDELGQTCPLVMYDQLGCGGSMPDEAVFEAALEAAGTDLAELYSLPTWKQELCEVLSQLGVSRAHVLGQSWGGMLALDFALDANAQTQTNFELASLILSSTLPSAELWGRENHRLAKQLSAAEWEAIAQSEATDNFADAAYQQAIAHFMSLHCADSPVPATAPEPLRRARQVGDKSYELAWGPNELMPRGSLATWDVTSRLHELQMPVLIVSGTEDLCTPVIAKTLYDGIRAGRSCEASAGRSPVCWELFVGCRHMCFADNTPRYLDLVRGWVRAF